MELLSYVPILSKLSCSIHIVCIRGEDDNDDFDNSCNERLFDNEDEDEDRIVMMTWQH